MRKGYQVKQDRKDGTVGLSYCWTFRGARRRYRRWMRTYPFDSASCGRRQ